MTIKKLHWNNKNDMHIADRALREEQVILGESDTVLGLFAPLSLKGFNRLNALKSRENKPYIILIQRESDINLFCDQTFLTGKMVNFFKQCWPGPVTCLVKSDPRLPDFIQGAHGTIALRWPDHQGLLELMKLTGPLFSTSANKTGFPIAQVIDDLDDTIINQIDYYIAHDMPDQNKSFLPSTIVDCTKHPIQIIRAGAYNLEKLIATYKNLTDDPV